MFYIFDCNGSLVGNPDGYSRYSDVSRVVHNKRTRIHKHIWNTFENRPNKSNNLVWETAKLSLEDLHAKLGIK